MKRIDFIHLRKRWNQGTFKDKSCFLLVMRMFLTRFNLPLVNWNHLAHTLLKFVYVWWLTVIANYMAISIWSYEAKSNEYGHIIKLTHQWSRIVIYSKIRDVPSQSRLAVRFLKRDWGQSRYTQLSSPCYDNQCQCSKSSTDSSMVIGHVWQGSNEKAQKCQSPLVRQSISM